MTLFLGWDGPEVTPEGVLRLDAVYKALRHLEVEHPNRSEPAAVRMRQLLREASEAARPGEQVRVHLSDLDFDGLWGACTGLRLLLRGVKGSRATFRVVITSGLASDSGLIAYQLPPSGVHIMRDGMAAVLQDARKAWRARGEALSRQRGAQEAAYMASLEGQPGHALQLTCRPDCIMVAPDGKSWTEVLHDTGGSLGYTEGRNGYVMPASLAAGQAAHDRIYHPQESTPADGPVKENS